MRKNGWQKPNTRERKLVKTGKKCRNVRRQQRASLEADFSVLQWQVPGQSAVNRRLIGDRGKTRSDSLSVAARRARSLSPSLSPSRSRLATTPRRDEAYRCERIARKERSNEETNGWTDSISQGPFCTTFSCFFFGYTSDELVRGSRRERTQ